MKRHKSLLLFVLPWALALSAGAPSSADAATTRFASPAVLIPLDTLGACTDISVPCSLPAALRAANPGDTISLAAGAYNAGALVLPSRAAALGADGPATRPVITSGLAVPTLDLTAAQSGTSFRRPRDRQHGSHQPALHGRPPARDGGLGGGALERPERSALRRGTGVGAAHEIDDSTMSTTSNTWCLGLGALSTVRHSTIGRSASLLPEIHRRSSEPMA